MHASALPVIKRILFDFQVSVDYNIKTLFKSLNRRTPDRPLSPEYYSDACWKAHYLREFLQMKNNRQTGSRRLVKMFE